MPIKTFNDEEVKSIVIRATYEIVAENEDVLDALNPQDRKKLIDRLLTDRLKFPIKPFYSELSSLFEFR